MAQYLDYPIWDQHSVCDVFWVSRAINLSSKTLGAFSSLTSLTDLVKQLASSNTGETGWLATGEDNDVVACSWTKDTESPSGVFNIQVKLRQDYMNKVRPGDLLFIAMDNDQQYALGVSRWLQTIGIVESVVKTASLEAGGAEVQTVTITGRDLGSVLQRTSTVFDPSFAAIAQTMFGGKFMDQVVNKQFALSPVESVLGLLNLVYNVQASESAIAALQWMLDTSGRTRPLVSLIDASTFVQAPLYGYAMPDSVALAQAGNVWNLLDQYANKVVNEFFVDVRDYSVDEVTFLEHQSRVMTPGLELTDVARQKAVVQELANSGVFVGAPYRGLTPSDPPPQVMAMVLRQRPYDTDAFQALPRVDVHISEVSNRELRLSSQEVLNFFRVRSPSIGPEYQELSYGIRVNIESVARFGICRCEAESQYFFASSEAATTYDTGGAKDGYFQSVIDFYTQLLSTWYAAGDSMLSGQLPLRHFRPDIRVGTRLRLWYDADVYIDFYTQAVQQSFSVQPGASQTILTLVRGVVGGSTGLEANLKWDTSGSRIPSSLNRFGTFTAAGFVWEGQQVQNEQGGF